MTVGSLFSGIGGLDLGLERAGHTVRWQVEADPYCRRVLAQHWPDIPCYPDVTHLTAETLEPVDLICGGFPCQPVSVAGAQKGTDDERWLWPHFARLLGALRPRYALLENVPGLLTANGGHAFGAILSDLADSGYDATWDSIPASALGAPHRRYRVFIIASLPDAERHRAGVQSRHAPSGGQAWEPSHASKPTLVRPEDRKADAERLAPSRQDVADAGYTGVQKRGITGSPEAPCDGSGRMEPDGVSGGCCTERTDLADAQELDQRARLCQSEPTEQRRGRSCDSSGTLADADHQRCVGGRQPEQHDQQGPRWREPDGRLSDGRFFDAPIRGEWPIEPDVGRVAHGVPQRVDRLKALGNAVVPQVAEWLGRRLQERRR
jgi:DNA (cytosine-5)-methyltransferase 1